jgi:hypothetical protein
MIVNFTLVGNTEDVVLLTVDMEAPPAQNWMIVINETVYECTGIKAVFTPARGGKHTYVIEVRIHPV